MGRASSLFHGGASETLHSRITPTVEQRDFLQEQWNVLAAQLVPALYADHGFPVSTWLQGSYKFGTLIKPVRKGEEYDVDVGVYFEWEQADPPPQGTPTPSEMRQWVQDELVNFQRHHAEARRVTEPKERCCRIVYASQFHIDTPIYHLDRALDQRRLARLSGAWEQSDPKAIYQWFKAAVNDDHRSQLRRLVRYMKAWAAVAFDAQKTARPTSVVLTVLCTNAYCAHLSNTSPLLDDDDALSIVIEEIWSTLQRGQWIANPVNNQENLNRLEPDDFQAFVATVSALREICSRAGEAEDEASAALVWTEAFSFLMPLPEADEVEVLDGRSGLAVMVLPEIDIEVYSRDPKQFRVRHRNEVPSVPKGCDLTFRIANPNVVPAFATVEWTVRNTGKDAEAIGDLGHRNIGARLLEVNEKTTYAGTQFMDCVVRLNGQPYAVRRVRVTIRDAGYPQRNPPKPAYTKLKSFLRRGR